MRGCPSFRAPPLGHQAAAGCRLRLRRGRGPLLAPPPPRRTSLMPWWRRVSGLPLEHILGWAEFCGLRIEVDAGVLCPAAAPGSWSRPRSSWPAPAARGARPSSSTCAADRGGRTAPAALGRPPGASRFGRRPRRGAVRGPQRRSARRCVHEGTSTTLSRPGCAAGSTSWWVNAPYVPSAEIGTLPQEARLHEPRVSSTAAQTGCRSSSGWPPRRCSGWRRRPPAGRDEPAAGPADGRAVHPQRTHRAEWPARGAGRHGGDRISRRVAQPSGRRSPPS